MNSEFQEFSSSNENTILVLGQENALDEYCTIDLSEGNKMIKSINLTKPESCQQYIDSVLTENKTKVAYGGYLEKRGLYADKANFSRLGSNRNIHLGIDFWAKSGTKVLTPINGKVHSFKNNNVVGDYGPTIILRHEFGEFTFHTLYGHLSLESISDIKVAQKFEKGSVVGRLGTPDINVNYAPHLHFQIVIDMEENMGDYPGVCSEDTLDFYSKNCPDPNLLLKMPL